MNPSRGGRSRLNHRHHRRHHQLEEEEEEVSLRASSACAADDLLGSGGKPSPPLAAGERARQSPARRPSDSHRAALGEQAAAREARLERTGSSGAVVRKRSDSAGCGVGVQELAPEARCSRGGGGEEDVAASRRSAGEKEAQLLRRLKSALVVSEVDGAQLRARCERLEDDLSESVRTGLAAWHEADRRAVRCRQLQREVRQLRESLGALQEVVSAAKIQASECRRDLHAVRLQQQQLQLLRAREQEMKQEMKSQLHQASQEFLLQEAERHGEMEQRYKSALAELQAAFLWTRQQLQTERQARRRDVASLELLRRHLLDL
ncbi:uncharacterized protein LOC133362869 [Lethenteron reissneri]|uniref:uncharacterized protein LOC133362869 n=1 Tax=Lethenteron reissneri TaxID=7753 RepID=UPI002AB72F39|nr:uncharacterized protein LOC133362869 [Lethenteron reissneri]XP_061437797.1 uncharacterized protein LOC133362869 [Lethenteron reissneri]